MRDDKDRGCLAAFGAEHRELCRLVRSIADGLASDRPWRHQRASGVLAGLRDLQNRLEHHFAREEAGGYLEEALTQAPRFSAQAAHLLEQHAQLLGQLRQVVQMAAAARETSSAWPALKGECATFIKELLAHEAAENQLVQEAFNIDLGQGN